MRMPNERNQPLYENLQYNHQNTSWGLYHVHDNLLLRKEERSIAK